MSDWFSTWELIRSAGFTSYLLLFVSVLAGVAVRGQMVSSKQKAVLLFVHQSAGWIGFLSGFFHGLLLTIDSYISFTLTDVFLPFASDYKTMLAGFGSLSLYGIAVVLISSDAMKKLSKKVWRTIHYLAFPAYLLAFIHGVFLGTDSGEVWSIIFYTTTIVSLLSIGLVRKLVISAKKHA